MTVKKIKGNFGVLLTYLGRLYTTPANAIKEYISNALDEWIKQQDKDKANKTCEVIYHIEKTKITIEYNSPGMDAKEFEAALSRVADSMKRQLTVPQIGELGIGIFAFNQIGGVCTFYSKKAKDSPTIKVVLTSNSDEFQIETAIRRECRTSPGMTIVISHLNHDPTKPRSSLSPQLLQKFFAEKFDSYLRTGKLKVSIVFDGKLFEVKPIDMNLQKIGEAFAQVHLSKDWKKIFNCQFWFDPSAKSHISVRHTGVPIIEDLQNYPALGLEDSIYTSGFIKGYLDADYLIPLPARTSFEENDDWVSFLVELDKIRPSIEDEIELLRQNEDENKLTEVHKQAIEIAKAILNQEQFKDLVPLGGLSRTRAPIVNPGIGGKTGKKTGQRSTKKGTQPSLPGFRISYAEIPFEDGPFKHSRFLSGIVQVNSLNQDYLRFKSSSYNEKLEYAGLMIGKEAVANTDKSTSSDFFLEKLVSYIFQLKQLTSSKQVKRKIGKHVAK